MASSRVLGNKLDELLKCPVCLDQFSEPRTLSCLHTFCTDCLEGCRRLLRRDIECPVCKRVSSLPQAGVRGLPTDYRIEQIREFFSDMQATDTPDPTDSSANAEVAKQCDVCKTEQKVVASTHHCVQCLMQLCDECVARHNSNPVLSSHQLIAVSDTRAVLAMFCTQHAQHPIRYFCADCRVTLCSVCAIGHDPSHQPELLEQGVLEKHRSLLTDKLRQLTSHLSDVKTRAKRINAVRQSRQNELYSVQQCIHDHSEQIVARIRAREAVLLSEAQAHFDSAASGDGCDSVAELDFRKSEIEKLISDIRQLLAGPPLSCLLAFDEIVGRVCRLTDASLHGGATSPGRRRTPKPIQFVATATSDVDIMIGWLQESSLDAAAGESEGPQSPSITCSTPRSTSDSQSGVTRKRTASILRAMSPVRKLDSRGCRMKSVVRQHQRMSCGGDAGDTLTATAGSVQPANGPTQSSASSSVSSPSRISTGTTAEIASTPSPSTSVPTAATAGGRMTFQAVPLFTINQVGVLQGMIQSPVGVTFLNKDVVVAEDYRVQRFDRRGRSLVVAGSYSLKPSGIAVTNDGLIAVADKASRTIRFFHPDGRDVRDHCWMDRLFGTPAGMAVVKSNGNVVVVDNERRTVTVYGTAEAQLPSLVCRVSADQFCNPTHVAVDSQGVMFVSDAGHACIKVFDQTGKLLHQFALPSRQSIKSWLPVCPYGLCLLGRTGLLAACDRDGNRIVLVTGTGADAGDLLTASDGLRYPCGVAAAETDNGHVLLAVIESCSGLMGNDPHHAVKLFEIRKSCRS